jgi:hypothetical protein
MRICCSPGTLEFFEQSQHQAFLEPSQTTQPTKRRMQNSEQLKSKQESLHLDPCSEVKRPAGVVRQALQQLVHVECRCAISLQNETAESVKLEADAAEHLGGDGDSRS